MRGPEHRLTIKSLLVRGALLLAIPSASGCFSTGEGVDPPEERIYFPVGLALDDRAENLVVLSSDYDLQYNAGTLQVLRLADEDGVRALLPKPCRTDAHCAATQRCDVEPTPENGGIRSWFCVDREGPHAGRPCGVVGERSREDQLLYPGRCQAIEPTRPPAGPSLIASAVEVGAFGTDVVFRKNPNEEAGGRIFFPVRGDATLHWADLSADGQVECGQRANRGACDDRHRVGDDPDEENTRDLRLAPEPFAIDASPDGRAIVVTHQTGDSVALFTNDWSNRGPELQFALHGLARRPVGVAALSPPAIVEESGGSYSPGFLISFRAAAQVNLVRYVADEGASTRRPYLAAAGASPILLNSIGTDSRGIAVDASERQAAEVECYDAAGCAPGSCDALDGASRAELLACLERAAAFGFDVYVANRTPETLLIGRATPAVNALFTTELPSFYDSIPLPLGPSRVLVGDVIVGGEAPDLQLERRVFVVCFDARRIVIYDPKQRRIEHEIETGRGPHAVAVDARHGLLFVGHFTDSFVGVVSVDRRFPETYGTMIGTIGTPTPPRASK